MSDRWTFLSNHGRVFEYITMHKQSSVEAMSLEVGITQRAVFKIIKDLESDGYITRKKIGRCNRYEVHSDPPMQHSFDSRGRIAGEILSE